jgi:hypothetical protein
MAVSWSFSERSETLISLATILFPSFLRFTSSAHLPPHATQRLIMSLNPGRGRAQAHTTGRKTQAGGASTRTRPVLSCAPSRNPRPWTSKTLEFVCAQEADGEDAVPRRSTGGALRGSGVQRFSREPGRAGGSVCAQKPAPRCDTLSAFVVAHVRRCLYEKKRRCLCVAWLKRAVRLPLRSASTALGCKQPRYRSSCARGPWAGCGCSLASNFRRTSRIQFRSFEAPSRFLSLSLPRALSLCVRDAPRNDARTLLLRRHCRTGAAGWWWRCHTPPTLGRKDASLSRPRT